MDNEEVLLKIKRKFTKDDAVSLLKEDLRKVNIKNGELLSEVSELKHEIEKLKLEMSWQGKTKRQWMRGERINELEVENSKIKKQNGNLSQMLRVSQQKEMEALIKLNQLKQNT